LFTGAFLSFAWDTREGSSLRARAPIRATGVVTFQLTGVSSCWGLPGGARLSGPRGARVWPIVCVPRQDAQDSAPDGVDDGVASHRQAKPDSPVDAFDRAKF